MSSNGELFLQRALLEAWKSTKGPLDRLIVFDVGANIGKWSAELIQRSAEYDMEAAVDLFAFEPAPSTFELLQQRLRGARCMVHFEHVALSSTTGKDFLYVSNNSHGINSLYADPSRAHEQRLPVMTITVSDFCKRTNIKTIHMLKCDTEGHDMEVIRGAMELLTTGSISVLQFEYNHRWIFSRNFLRDAFMAVQDLPYRIAKLQDDHLLLLTEWHPELETFFEGNYALVRADALSWFPMRTAVFDKYNTMHIE